ncbi:MAG: LytR/AlgR family response regulator transcription factor [Gammaproteobacteria bacterium]
MKILIVDDEKLARERLQDLIKEDDCNHVVLEADNGITALQSVDKEQPDVILLDIRMPIMDGLETAYHLAALEPAPAIVFTTAYQDHAIEAFETNAVDYLLKPVRLQRLQKALERAQVLNRARLASLRVKDPGIKPRSHLSTTRQGKVELIPVGEIAYLKAEQKYVTAGWRGRERLIDESLKSLEAEFSGYFLRIHRNALVAPEHIEALERDQDGSFRVQLRNASDRLAVSRRHLHKVRRALKQSS